jgi:hypothetical protein
MCRSLVQKFACVLALVLLCLGARPIVSFAADLQPAPPSDATIVRDVQAGGAQVYACRKSSPTTFGWVLVGPKAVLINANGTDFGTHSAGPTWTAQDGSTISADGAHPLAKVDRAGAVPALLLSVTSSHGNGVLTGVRYVRRADTEGGLPPAAGCDAEHLDSSVASHYSATYTFYR